MTYDLSSWSMSSLTFSLHWHIEFIDFISTQQSSTDIKHGDYVCHKSFSFLPKIRMTFATSFNFDVVSVDRIDNQNASCAHKNERQNFVSM